MNRRTLLLLLAFLITGILSAESARVVVFDLSFSMGLPAGAGVPRKELLESQLQADLNASTSELALITFDDVDSVTIAAPYPSSAGAVLQAVRAASPWGRSPVVAAVRQAFTYASELVSDSTVSGVDSVRVVLYSDGEDGDDFVRESQSLGSPPVPVPGSGAITLDVVTTGSLAPGFSPTLQRWVRETGGLLVDLGDHSTTQFAPISADSVDHERDRESSARALTAIGRAQTDSRSPVIRVLWAWLMVARWNLLAAVVLGAYVIYRALRRLSRRRDNIRRRNSDPLRVTLEIRTTLRRYEQTLKKLPATVGTTPGSTVELDNSASKPPQQFLVDLHDGTLVFHSEDKLNVNGVTRSERELSPGDQIRLGKYRISLVEFTELKPIPLPAAIPWRTGLLPGLSLVAVLFLFIIAPTFDNLAPPRVAAKASPGPLPDSVTPSASADEELPPPRDPVRSTLVYRRTDPIPPFDADYVLIHAHPDDETLDNGVLVSRLSAAGLRGVVILLTDGESGRDQYPQRSAGGMYPAYDLSGTDLIRVRIIEAQSALSILGVQAYVRGELPNFPYNSITDELTPNQVIARWGGLDAIVNTLQQVVIPFQPEFIISPDGPADSREHFEHEATGIIVQELVSRLETTGYKIRGHLHGVDPLQTHAYERLVTVDPWDEHPATGESYRSIQIRALTKHATQRDAAAVGIETRLAVPFEYYAVGRWDPAYSLPDEIGLSHSAAEMSRMARRP